MKPDLIDLWIFETVKEGLKKLVPIKFTGEMAFINGYIQGLIILYAVGEILVAIVKRHEAKKKVRLFGMKRND